MLELTVRLVVSLAIVVGLLLVLARVGARKFRGNAAALVHVVHRQPLSRTSSVAVVTVGTRVLVLGTTEQQISVLAELDPDELDSGTFADLDGDVLALDEAGALDAPLDAPLDDLAGRRRDRAVVVPTDLDDLLTVPTLAAPTGPVRAPGSHRAAAVPRTGTVPTGNGPLAGSVLSVQTWRQAFAAATSRGTRTTARRAS